MFAFECLQSTLTLATMIRLFSGAFLGAQFFLVLSTVLVAAVCFACPLAVASSLAAAPGAFSLALPFLAAVVGVFPLAFSSLVAAADA